MSVDLFMSALKDFVDGCPSQKWAADRLDLSQQFLCDVLKGRRQPSAKLAAALGWVREVVYRKPESGKERDKREAREALERL